jgi:hypothetical protein
MLNITGAGIVPIGAQVYVRSDSPLSSAPSAESAAVVVVTGFGLAEAAAAMVGAELTVAVAVPLTPALVAVTVKLPDVVPAVNSPSPPIDPPPLTLQVKAGCIVWSVPNWSRARAVNCCASNALTMALAGETTMLVNV